MLDAAGALQSFTLLFPTRKPMSTRDSTLREITFESNGLQRMKPRFQDHVLPRSIHPLVRRSGSLPSGADVSWLRRR